MIESEKLDAYVRYRIEKSKEVYLAAKLLVEAKMWNSAVNRLYYSCFHAVTALLIHNNITAKTHSGAISQFSEHFVRTNIFTTVEFRIYSKLMNWREKSDYSDMYDFEEEDVLPLMTPTCDFIKHIISLIDL